MRWSIIRGGPWKNWTEPTTDVSLERTSVLSSLYRDTLATTLCPEPLANQPPLTQAYIFRVTPAQTAPIPGAPANPASCGRGDAAPHGPAPSFSSLHRLRGPPRSVGDLFSFSLTSLLIYVQKISLDPLVRGWGCR